MVHSDLSWNRHLIVVERFACPCEPESCVVWSLVLLVGSLMAEWSQVRGQTKNGSKILNEQRKKRRCDPARRKPGAPVWSQAQTEGSMASAWWPGLPRSPVGHSPNKLRGTPPLFIPWAHHLWEDPLGSGAQPHGWQRRSGVSTDQTRAAEAGSGDVERHLAVGKVTGAFEGGGALSVRSGGAYLHAQSQLWYRTPG